MSWIIQHLLKNRDIIKEKKDIDSDEFNDLLVVEAKINELRDVGMLSEIEVTIIDLMSDGRPIVGLEATIGKKRLTLSRSFVQICNRIAYTLGGYFTDDGFLQHMQTTYHLSEADVDKLRRHIESKDKHKLIRSLK